MSRHPCPHTDGCGDAENAHALKSGHDAGTMDLRDQGVMLTCSACSERVRRY